MRIFSGIQPTGRKHLGNYIGAIQHYVAGQDAGESIYCVVDLHATTVPYDPRELRERLYDTAAILIAAGLDPERPAEPRPGPGATAAAGECGRCADRAPTPEPGREPSLAPT